MAVITALRLQTKNRQRVNVYLDGSYRLSVDRVLAVGLRLGQELTPAQLEDLTRKDEVEAACRHAARLLARRPRSERELRDAWTRRRIDAGTQAAALDRLRASGQLDDGAFARTWVENRIAFRPRGLLALRTELRRKGVSDEIIEDSLRSVNELAAAHAAALKPSKRWQGLSKDEFEGRLRGYLQRRGFGYEVISTVVKQIWREGMAAGDEREVRS